MMWGQLCTNQLPGMVTNDSNTYDMCSIVVQGEVDDGTFPLPSSGISCGHGLFSAHVLECSTWFQDIEPPLSNNVADYYFLSEINCCYKAFFRPDVAAPMFCILICESYFLAPKDWTP